MKIIRVLNTNAVLSQDENKEEIILLGAGIGFKRRVGDDVEEGKIEKWFVMKDKAHQSRFLELLNGIPREYIMLAEQIISLGIAYHMKLNESIHISLADHIHTAVENLKKGIAIPNPLIFDIQHFYQDEYQIALRGLALVRDQLGCELPGDEAGFIAMHFVNAQYGSESTNVKQTIRFVREVNELVLRELNGKADESSLSYYRYMTHLKFFAQRVMAGHHYHDDMGSILDKLLVMFKKEYACSKKVAKFVWENYHYQVGRDEMLYLTVHLAHLTQKT